MPLARREVLATIGVAALLAAAVLVLPPRGLQAGDAVAAAIAQAPPLAQPPAPDAQPPSPDALPPAADPDAPPPPERGLPPDPLAASQPKPQLFRVPPPPFSKGAFPCSECHADLDTDPTPRPMREKHRKIKLQHHDEENRWCLDCHDTADRDRLHLASGKLIEFEESYRLCGQCHGEKLRDWKAGVHGKRTGMWNGAKEYLLCAHCHNPHSPRFKPIPPEPPPLRPTDIR